MIEKLCACGCGDFVNTPAATYLPGHQNRRFPRTCTHPDGCTRPHNSHGLCTDHGRRLRETGSLGPANFRPQRPIGRPCCVPGCENVVTKDSARDMCGKHYQRYLAHGDVHALKVRAGPNHPGWRGDSVSYHRAHARVTDLHGPPGQQACVDCSQPADEWSYDHTDPDAKQDSRGYWFSLDPSHYQPRCVRCHRRFDAAYRQETG